MIMYCCSSSVYSLYNIVLLKQRAIQHFTHIYLDNFNYFGHISYIGQTRRMVLSVGAYFNTPWWLLRQK